MEEGRDNLQRAQNPGETLSVFFKDVKTHVSRLWRREEEVKIMEEREEQVEKAAWKSENWHRSS